MGRKLFTASMCSLFLFTLALPQNRVGKPQSAVFLSGEVVLEDGTYPEEPVRVELVCEGSVRRQTFTHQGMYRLAFNAGTAQAGTVPDASMSEPPRETEFFQAERNSLGGPSQAYAPQVVNTLDLTGCELRARLAGFQSNPVSLGRRKPLDRTEVKTMVLRYVGTVEGSTISLNSLKAPDKAKKAYRSAYKELRKKTPSLSKARRELDRAVKEFPDFAAGWQLLGEVHLRRTDEPSARQAFAQAMAADPKYIRPYLSLASLEFDHNRWGEVEKLCSQVIGLTPDSTYAHYLCGAANYSLGKLDAAEESIRKVLASNEANRYPVADFILGGILTDRGDIPSATVELRRFLTVQPQGPLAAQARRYLEDWEQQGLIDPEKPQTTGSQTTEP